MRLVVLGMHRSGTSVATGVLELAGAWVGGPAELTRANAENPRGFFERRDVREVCDAILQSHGMDWWRTSASETDFEPDRVRPHLERFAEIVDELDARGTWVIKEPRLCLVLPALLPALDGARFVHVTREPLEVASSLASRNAIPPLAGLALWEQYVRSAVHHTAGRPRTMVRYERLVADPLRTTTELVGSLAELGVDDLVIPSAEALGSLVTGDLHRERASPAERGARFNAIQARLASAVDDETLLEGSWDGGGLSAGARETLAEFEATRDGEQLVGATREALAAERRRADDAERDAEAARRAELNVRARAGAAVEDVRVRIDGVSRSRPWRAVASLHRAGRVVTGATRFDHDHLQMAARELRLLRDSLVPDGETPDPSWAHNERLPSGRILHHSQLPSEPTGRRRIAVLAWDVGHNPLGRAHTMADILRDHAEVSIWGTSFERYGSGLWPPLRGTDIPVHALRGLDLPELLDALDELARRIDVDAVWVSKPRFPSLALGALVKRYHGCPLIVDVDDHEQAFFGIDSPLDPASLWDLDRDELRTPYGEAWTRACESVIGHADLLTVSNEALQQRFGGVVVPHARRPDAFDPTLVDRDKVRSELGVADGDRLLLFGGTPRVHKGVLEVLEALDEIGDPRNRLLLFGTRELSELGSDLDRLRRWTLTVPPRSFADLPAVVAAADLSCVLQDPQHPVSLYQVPAKLTDSLAMGVPCVVRAVPPLQPMIDAGIVATVDDHRSLVGTLRQLLDDEDGRRTLGAAGRSYFQSELSTPAVASRLMPSIEALIDSPPPESAPLARFAGLPDRLLPRPERVVPRTPGSRRHESPTDGRYDLVMFWRQNDSSLYGRRPDMLLEYLRRSGRFRRIVHFDSPITPGQLGRLWREADTASDQRRFVARQTVERMLHRHDDDVVQRRTFLHSGRDRPRFGVPPLSDYPRAVDKVLRANGIGDRFTIFWVWPPNPSFSALVDQLRPDLVVTDVVDDNRSWYHPGDPGWLRVEADYRAAVARSEIVLANCEPVVEAVEELTGRRPALVPNGLELPDRRPQGPRPRVLAALPPGPIVAYAGNLSARLDLELLDGLVTRRPEWQFALMGSAHLDRAALRLDEHPNVHFLGVRPYPELKRILQAVDVGIVPHLDDDMTRSMNPLKVYVYVAAGLPVVSTPVSNLETFGGTVRVASGIDAFESAVADALRAGRPDVDTAVLVSHSWEQRVAAVLELIDAAAAVTGG